MLHFCSTLTEADDVLIVEMYIRRSSRRGFYSPAADFLLQINQAKRKYLAAPNRCSRITAAAHSEITEGFISFVVGVEVPN